MIWGARMTGLGALRQLSSRHINVLNFIDSDLSFKNKKVHNLDVIEPYDIVNFVKKSDKKIVILLAVSIKEEEIIQQLKTHNLDKMLEVVSFLDENAPYFTVDILGSCNLKCASCPHSILDSTVPKGSMKLETFKKVFDKILSESPNITHLCLYSWGEPFMHPYLEEIIKYVHSKNVAVALSSNLSIKFYERIERVIKCSPEYLKVSLSGFFPEAYNNTHQGGDINLVKKNLIYINELIKKYNANTLIDINYHLYRDNCRENLNEMTKFADKYGFILSSTYSLVMPLERVISKLEGVTDEQTKKLEENLLVTIEEGINASSKVNLPKNTCPFRENQININSDLTVPVCCTVWERQDNVVAQNYLNTSIKEINNQKRKISTCDKCMNYRLPEYNMGFNKQGWKNYADEKIILDRGE